MELLPKEIADRIPPLYTYEGRPNDAVAHARFFTPWTTWTWYVSEYDPVERLCFGLFVGRQLMFDFFPLDELESARSPWGHRTVCDRAWKPRRLNKCP